MKPVRAEWMRSYQSFIFIVMVEMMKPWHYTLIATEVPRDKLEKYAMQKKIIAQRIKEREKNAAEIVICVMGDTKRNCWWCVCRPEENLRGCGRAVEIRLLIRTGFRKDFRLPIVISQCKHLHAECLIRLKKLETTDGLAALNEKTHITLFCLTGPNARSRTCTVARFFYWDYFRFCCFCWLLWRRQKKT